MRFCKHCGAELLEESAICPICGGQLKSEILLAASDSTGKSKKRLAMMLALSLLVLIAIVVFCGTPAKCESSGCKNKPVSGSNYCYSHKCAYSSCMKERFMYSNYCYTHYLQFDDDASSSRVSASDLKVKIEDFYTKRSYMYVEGTLKNNSDTTVYYVKIKVSFKDSSGAVIDTDWTYAVGSEGLAPGESCKWDVMQSNDSRVTSCGASVIDFDT